jgi:3-hydroxyacyl-[acyl-carrier-protein] dehydratase
LPERDCSGSSVNAGSNVQVASSDPILDLSTLDFSNVIADAAEIRKYNPQRYEMEQLTAIVYEDLQNNICAGYKDVSREEFWVRGHMPGLPLLPGVLMLEAAAQMCSYFSQKHDILGVEMIGFGGLDDVRFRDPVLPSDRLIVICQMIKLRRGRIVLTKFQGFVGQSMVVEGLLKGIPSPVEAVRQLLESRAQV